MLEELVYFKLEVPQDRLLPEVEDTLIGGHWDVPEWQYRANLTFILYEITKRLKTDILEEEIYTMANNDSMHRRRFMDHHMMHGWDGEPTSIAWKIPPVGEFVGYMGKCDGSIADALAVDERGHIAARRGIVFLRETADNQEKFMRIFRRLMGHFSPAAQAVAQAHQTSVERYNLMWYR